MPGGQPTKLTEKMKERVKFLATKGFTDKEIAKAVDVSHSTIDNWKNQDPEFLGSLRDWKADFDTKIERALAERAMGYSHKEDKIFPVLNDEGEPLIVPTIKHYPPDTKACSIWLNNRKPKDWSDRRVVEVTGDEALVNALTAARNRAGKE